MSWYLRSWAPGDVHHGVFEEGSVRAACGTEFFPQWISGQVALRQLPHPEQLCPACLAQANDPHIIVIPAQCATHPDATDVVAVVVRRREGGRITLESHASGGCALTLEATLLFDVLGEWLG